MKKVKKYNINEMNYIDIITLLSLNLKNRIKKLMRLHKYENIIILCIGTDKVKNDSYGPIIGLELMQKPLPKNIKIFGSIGATLNACNLLPFINQNADELNNSLVIAIDSILSSTTPIGTIITSNSGIYPGEGLHKDLPYIGDISMCGVLSDSIDSFRYLDIDDELLMKICSVTAHSLYTAFMSIEEEKQNCNQEFNDSDNKSLKNTLFNLY